MSTAFKFVTDLSNCSFSDSDGIKFSANAPVFKPRGQPQNVYPQHPQHAPIPPAEPRAPRPMAPPMQGTVNTPAHSIATFPPQSTFPPQQRAPFSIPRKYCDVISCRFIQ